METILAYTELTDGTRRPVYDDGKCQYVIDDDGNPIFGIWFIPPEENILPIIVDANPDCSKLPADS